jgi:hypothetical protein
LGAEHLQYNNIAENAVNDNEKDLISAIMSSPEGGQYMPPHLASRRDSSSRAKGECDPVVTQDSPAAHPMPERR